MAVATKITDVHDSHGLVFTLHIKKSKRKSDKETLEFLKRKLLPLISGAYRNQSTLYVHRIAFTPNGCSLQFVEQNKQAVRLRYRYNTDRKDGKYQVLVIEVEGEKVPGG